jgi:uncharacterized protein (DUF983 family)
MPQATVRRSLLSAILRQRCPRCRQGPIFGGLFATNESCPVCGLQFEREQGYFLGAMYLSYPLSVPILGLIILIEYLLLPDWRIEYLILLSLIPYIPFAPLVFRYSRVLWIYLERAISPNF